MTLWIGVTYRCQCKCVHCFVGPQLNINNNELSSDEIYNQIETARRLGFMEICFFGGEPLLREDIVDLVGFSSKKGLHTTIISNGILITPEKTEALKRAGLAQCNISLDSASSTQHDLLRGYKGCHEKALEGIKNMLNSGIECSIWTYVKKADAQGSLTDLRAIIEIGRNLKVGEVFVLYPCASGNWLDDNKNILTGPEREKVREFVKHYTNKPMVKLEFPSEKSMCTAGSKFIYINPHGDVAPCPAMDRFSGNIHEESLDVILKRLKKQFVESEIRACGECTMNFNSSLLDVNTEGCKNLTTSEKK